MTTENRGKIDPKTISRGICGVLFTLAGIWHFVRPDIYVKIMPEWLPAHLELVYLSGVVEILGGVTLLAPKTKLLGAWILIATLVGVYPANIHMATRPDLFPNIPYWVLIARLPLQAVLIYWVWKCSR